MWRSYICLILHTKTYTIGVPKNENLCQEINFIGYLNKFDNVTEYLPLFQAESQIWHPHL